MAENSKIEWTTHTFNPWVGCQKISPACEHCYAESWAKRTGQAGLWRGERRRTSAANWKLPRKWNKEAENAAQRPRVFCSSLADVFEDHPAIDSQWRIELFNLINETPNLDWLLLTKRPDNANRMIADIFQELDWFDPLEQMNLWIGTTVENQEQANKRIPELLKIPTKIRFLSVEPMLGKIDLNAITNGNHCFSALECDVDDEDDEWAGNSVDWVICGGESGGNARPMHPQWARELRDQCVRANIPFHFKQWGEWAEGWSNLLPLHNFNDGHFATRIGKAKAGRILDGRTWDELPK